MANQDLKNNISVATTLAPDAYTANVTGNTVDLNGYESAAIVAVVGAITDGTHSLTVQESDDGSTWSDVDASQLQGSFADLASNTNQEVGYIGNKRYIRVNTTVAGATDGGKYAVVIVRGNPKVAPI